jgi:hypothetical protein
MRTGAFQAAMYRELAYQSYRVIYKYDMILSVLAYIKFEHAISVIMPRAATGIIRSLPNCMSALVT